MFSLNFVKPEHIFVLSLTEKKGSFKIEPFSSGFATTIGNSLRRVLLSSLEGFAITSIKIKGITHEFSILKGIVEDVTEIILNLKRIRFKKKIKKEIDKETIFVSILNKEKITAGDFGKFTSSFEVLNKNLIICRKDKSVPFEITFNIERGVGYIPSYANINYGLDFLPIDSIFTPIKKVKFSIESYRVLKKINWERLFLNIKTDGSINPIEALTKASEILIQHFLIFSEENIPKKVSKVKKNKMYDENFLKMRHVLRSKLSDVSDLSVRTLNCLKNYNIITFNELIVYKKKELMKLKNLGKKSLKELLLKMESLGLYPGIDISKYDL
jgi:DNA-directed RNA polymerase subunit alpha